MKIIYYSFKVIILLTFGFFLLHSCSSLDNNEPLPSFIYIEGYDFTTEENQGSNSQNIPYAWLNVGGDFAGSYEMPSLIPVNYYGDYEITINPNIVYNGISDDFALNEVMSPYKVKINLVEGEIDTIRAQFKYDETATFKIINDFEDGTHNFREDLDTFPETKIRITEGNAFEGKSGVIRLDKNNSRLIVTNKLDITDLPKNSSQKILELDYKTDVNILFGLRYYGINQDTTEILEFGLNPNQEWNKVYLNYSKLINDVNSANGLQVDRIRIIIAAELPRNRATGEFELEEAYIYLDNIKFTHE